MLGKGRWGRSAEVGFLPPARTPPSVRASRSHGAKAWLRAQSHKQWGTNLCPEPVCSAPGSYGLRHSQTRELLEEISPQALNYHPWPSIQDCFPAGTVSRNPVSIGQCLSLSPGPPGDPRGLRRLPGAAPHSGWLCLCAVGTVSRGWVSRGPG